jgi:hypothetical protein
MKKMELLMLQFTIAIKKSISSNAHWYTVITNYPIKIK